MNNMLKELVKKHFNLVEAPAEVEETKVEMNEEVVAQIFGEIKTADGELTLTYEGEEFTVGTEIFVVTTDGNVPAPDGEHMLEGGIKIETEGGVITSIEREEEDLPEIADETTAGEYPKEEMAEEEEVVVEETVMEVGVEEAIVSAIAEVIAPMIDEMKKEIEEMKAKFTATEKKVETFGLQPAAERTKAEIKNRNTVKTAVDYTPLNDDKKLQFERLLKIRNKK
jgi:hypothetical protein